jgi:hypothetical protein
MDEMPPSLPSFTHGPACGLASHSAGSLLSLELNKLID